MKSGKWIPIIVMLICLAFSAPYSMAAEGTEGSGSSNPLFDGLMNALQEGLQEGIDEFIGSYKGSLGDVRLLERLGNKIVLEVTYNNVKRSDNVYVQGEVQYFGEKLEGFKNTLSAVRGSHGKAILSIGWAPEEDEGWGTAVSEVQSDQIRLYLVRQSNPERPFGEIIYDMNKLWTGSDAPDEELMAADDDFIEMEPGEMEDDSSTGSSGSGQGAPSIFIKPGTILKPSSPAASNIPQTSGQSAGSMSTPSAEQLPQAEADKAPAAPILAPSGLKATVMPLQPAIDSYDFYQNARSAQWRSSAGSFAYPGRPDDKKGYVRRLSRGTLNSGNKAVSLLQTYPAFQVNGWIDAHYPAMVLGQGIHFKTIVGFLKGADKTDGATFRVYVKDAGKYVRVASKRVSGERYATIDADLSRWAGKKVQLMLRVGAGNTSIHDYAVWVKPRLSK